MPLHHVGVRSSAVTVLRFRRQLLARENHVTQRELQKIFARIPILGKRTLVCIQKLESGGIVDPDCQRIPIEQDAHRRDRRLRRQFISFLRNVRSHYRTPQNNSENKLSGSEPCEGRYPHTNVRFGAIITPNPGIGRMKQSKLPSNNNWRAMDFFSSHAAPLPDGKQFVDSLPLKLIHWRLPLWIFLHSACFL